MFLGKCHEHLFVSSEYVIDAFWCQSYKTLFFHHQQWDNKCQMFCPEIFRNILSLIRTAKAYPSVALTMSFSFYRFLDLLDSRGKLALNKWGHFYLIVGNKKSFIR